MTRLRRPARVQGDAGVGLPELLVATVVSMIVLGALGTVFSSSLSATRQASASVSATAEARLAQDVLARRLRVAVRADGAPAVLTSASATAVSFTASLTTPGSDAAVGPSTVSYAVVGGCLQETITPASGVSKTSCVARGVTSLALAYYLVKPWPNAATPSPSAVATTPLPFGADGLLPSADLDRVREVEIGLKVRDPRDAAARPVELRTRVLLVNRLNEDLK